LDQDAQHAKKVSPGLKVHCLQKTVFNHLDCITNNGSSSGHSPLVRQNSKISRANAPNRPGLLILAKCDQAFGIKFFEIAMVLRV